MRTPYHPFPPSPGMTGGGIPSDEIRRRMEESQRLGPEAPTWKPPGYL